MPIKRVRRVKQKTMTKPHVLSFIAYTLILFFGTTILTNINPNANEFYRLDWEARNNKNLQWIFVSDNGDEINIDEVARWSANWEHGAAWDYSFLLPNYNLDDINPRENNWYEIIDEELEHGAATEDEASLEEEGLEIKEPLKASVLLWDHLEDRSVFINTVYEYLLAWKIAELPEWAARYVVILYWMDEELQDKAYEEKSCLTPWWYEIDHWGSVFAYQQRTDTPEVCNVQRRVCKNGKLSWYYTLPSCVINLDWSVNWVDNSFQEQPSTNWLATSNIKDVPFHTYNNQSDKWEFVQPKKVARTNTNYDLKWKINWVMEPRYIAWEISDWYEEEIPAVEQTQNPRKYCVAPWGEKVQQWQFVKAYRYQNWFYDIPCQVQIRLCVDWELEWTYQNPTCDFWNTSYEDFLDWYMDSEQPSPKRLLKMLQTDFEPDPEYWNNLAPEIIDKLLNILREDPEDWDIRL